MILENECSIWLLTTVETVTSILWEWFLHILSFFKPNYSLALQPREQYDQETHRARCDFAWPFKAFSGMSVCTFEIKDFAFEDEESPDLRS